MWTRWTRLLQNKNSDIWRLCERQVAIAFVIAGLTPNTQTAANVGATISFLLFGFTGVMLPDIVPYTSLIKAIRGIALTGEGISVHGNHLLVGLVWLVVAFIAASFAYRFTDE